MESNVRHLFVYGTLRQNSSCEEARFLASFAVFTGPGIFQGKLYRVDDYPGAVPSNHPGERVIGDVYRLPKGESVLSRLDSYEECGPDFPEPAEYVREIHPIRLKNGAVIDAWIYIYNKPTDRLTSIKSGDFLKHCEKKTSNY